MTTPTSQVSDKLSELLHRGYRYAYSLTHHKSTAEDLLQDAWVAVLQARGPHTTGYLFSAIRSRFLNHNKRERLVSMIALDDALAENSAEHGQHDPDPLLRADTAAMDAALARLRPVEREVLFLSAVEGYTTEEIARNICQPRGTILSLLHRARLKLRRALSPNAEQRETGS